MRSKMMLLVAIMLVGSCGSDNKAGPNSFTGSRLFDSGENAFETTGGQLPAAKILNRLSLTAKSLKGLKNSNCDQSGVFADANAVLTYVICLFDTNSESPDTFQGALWLGKTIMSETENSMQYEYNQTATVHNNISVNVGGQLTISLQEQALPASDFWDYRINIDTANATFTARTHSLWLKDSGGFFGAKLFNQQDGGDAFILLVDTRNNIIRFENWDVDDDNSQSVDRHTRLYAKGSIGLDGTVSALSDIVIIHSDSGISPAGVVAARSEDGVNVKLNSWNSTGVSQIDGCVGGTCPNIGVTFNTSFITFDNNDTDDIDTNNSGQLTFDASNIDMSTTQL